MAAGINRLRPWEECNSNHRTKTDRRSSLIEETDTCKPWCSQRPSDFTGVASSSLSSLTEPHESRPPSTVAGEPSTWRLTSHPPAGKCPRLRENGRTRFLGSKGPQEVMNEPLDVLEAPFICPTIKPRRGCPESDHVAASPTTSSHELVQSLIHARSGDVAMDAHSDVNPPEETGSRDYHDSSRARQQLRELGLGLRQLEGELQRGLDGPTRCESTPDVEGELATTRQVLDWTLGSIRQGLRMVRTMAYTADTSAAGGTVLGRLDPRPARLSGEIRRPCPLAIGALHAREDQEGDFRGRFHSMDESALDIIAARSPTSRFLPPPTPVSAYSGLHAPLPISPSSPASRTAQATHVQNLQHQISTKTLALQTLQQEHNRLLSAYSRSQTRGAALERRSHVSDEEMNNLINEAVDAQVQLEVAEAQITGLKERLQAAQTEADNLRSQYIKIVEGASNLQQLDLDMLKKKQATQAELEERIAQLEFENTDIWTVAMARHHPSAAGDEDGVTASNATPIPTDYHIYSSESIKSPIQSLAVSEPSNADETDAAIGENDVLHSTSTNILRCEIIRLRQACLEKDAVLQEVARMGRQVETKAESVILPVKRKRETTDDDGRCDDEDDGNDETEKDNDEGRDQSDEDD